MEPKKDIGLTQVRIRKAIEEDVPFIFKSWLKSCRGMPLAKDLNNTIYYAEHHKVVERLLKSCDVYIACDDADPSDIYGFMCAEYISNVFVLHFAYVKHTYRNLGIGMMLLNAFKPDVSLASIYTHQTPAAVRLAAKFNMYYSPYPALTPDYRNNRPEDKLHIPEELDREEIKNERG